MEISMTKIDPQLQFLVDNDRPFLRESEAVAPSSPLESMADARTVVLVEFNGSMTELEARGLQIRSVSHDSDQKEPSVATGVIAVARVQALAQFENVLRLESTREMHSELDQSVPETRADIVHVGPPGRRGEGVIVGIVDSGVDFTHANFRKPDGTSRILFLWDQFLAPVNNENSPSGFGFGVEYSRAAINAALRDSDPFATVRHQDIAPMHGTHVTGIAAGDGSAPGEGRPPFTFVGVAPEADIIVVANRGSGTEGIGTSSNTLDAVNYIFSRAAELHRPAAVNMSLGDNLGPHDGTSLLERGIDNLLGGAGRAFVKSAGNAGADRIHASGTVTEGATVDVAFNMPAEAGSPAQIDLWYNGDDEFTAAIVNPARESTPAVTIRNALTSTLASGDTVRVDHRDKDSRNGDRRIFVTMRPGDSGALEEGRWLLRLVGKTSPRGGAFHAWIQRGNVIPRFLPPHVNSAVTISTPGTARGVITAASYVTRGAGVGSLSSFSSRGPTRDKRAAPTIAAPGQAIISANGHASTPYQTMSGTSMATPHVTGAIALMLQKDPTLTQQAISNHLVASARSDVQTGPVPNTAWGAGKMDVKGAVDTVPTQPLVVAGVAGGTEAVAEAAAGVPAQGYFEYDPRWFDTA
jgi:subtilisin family serine protease